MADIDLPLWSVPPNWSTAVTERLDWLTDVMTSSTGAEQRRALRVSPRRTIEFRCNPVGRARAFLELWLHKIGDEPCLMPLWHDKAKLSAPAVAGTLRLAFDNTYREFGTSGLAVLYRSVFEYRVVAYTAADPAGVTLAGPLNGTWPIGSTLYPLRRALLEPELTSRALTSQVGDVTVIATVDGPNDYDGGPETLEVYEGLPVISLEPNRADDLTMAYARLRDEVDGNFGRVFRRSWADRAFTTQFYNWQARGRAQHHALRQTLYRLEGRQKAAWMPTFNDDIVLASPLAAGQARLTFGAIGYGLLGGPSAGREHLLVRDAGHSAHIVRMTAMQAPPATGQERVGLSQAAGFAAPAGRRCSFVDTVRLEQDSVEIVHHTDSAGMAECTASFKSFANTRVEGSLEHTRAPAVRSEIACGEPETNNPCAAVFPGWYWEMTYEVARTGGVDVPLYLYQIVPWDYGDRWEYSPGDTYNWSWKMRSLSDRLPGSGPWFWEIQFLIGWGDGANCYEPWPPNPERCIGRVYARRWDQPNRTLVNEDQHYRGGPMSKLFYLPL